MCADVELLHDHLLKQILDFYTSMSEYMLKLLSTPDCKLYPVEIISNWETGEYLYIDECTNDEVDDSSDEENNSPMDSSKYFKPPPMYFTTFATDKIYHLPTTAPPEFYALPEYFVEDIAEFLLFALQ
ncbi:hypothetical protein J437_LFUL019676 [Ladona fulva]|uniref:Ubiquitin conjugation factor E4 core domain-containing protein n=1 Tax=Ladona fulva TaxID=123851 RepID=A0A8K0PCP3_LADFU|nr:hypothetical protein J437_LFUL019676 [Ladona fulva]